jgi:hypothetical protein
MTVLDWWAATMQPDDPRHGTYAGGQAHIRARTPMCEPCRQSFLKYRNQRRRDKAMGRVRIVPTEPVTKHLKRLRKQGVTVQSVADESGVSYSLVDELMNRPRTSMRSDNADAIMATNPAPAGFVPAIGSIRRIRALGRRGWSMPDIVRASNGGVTLSVLRRINAPAYDQQTVMHATHKAIADAYDQLAMTEPPQNRTATQVRVKAKLAGWVGPLSWDDPDNPAERPKGLGKPAAVDRADILTDLDEWGAGISEALRRLDMNRDALQKWCSREGKSELYRRLVAREKFTPNGVMQQDGAA